jgi:ankyrin repeat protein
MAESLPPDCDKNEFKSYCDNNNYKDDDDDDDDEIPEGNSTDDDSNADSVYINGNYESVLELKRAYSQQDWDVLDKLLISLVDNSNVIGLKKLHTAAGYGFAHLIQRYLKEDDVDVNCECIFNNLKSITPLHFCAGIGPDPITDERDQCIKILIENGAKVNHVTSRNDTPLHWATKLTNINICKELVSLGADVNALNADNCTCAHGAAYYKKCDILELLLESNINVNQLDISGKNILHLLCKDSFTDTVDDNNNNSDTSINCSDKYNLKNDNIIKIVEKLLGIKIQFNFF